MAKNGIMSNGRRACVFLVAGMMCFVSGVGPVFGKTSEIPSYEEQPSPPSVPVVKQEYKSPEMALAIGFLPGYLVHGAGHLYAGDFNTAVVLLGLEMVSLTAAGVGVMTEWDNIMAGRTTIRNFSGSQGGGLIWTGFIVFHVAWMVDFLRAPQAAEDYNRAHRLKPAWNLELRGGQPVLAWQTGF